MDKPFNYFGGKHFLLPKLLPLIPKHRCFVEVFGGGASLLFGHPRSKVEIYNDIDSALVDFFRVLQHPEESERLIEKLKVTPYSRELYIEYRDWQDETDRVERVYKWYFIALSCYSGDFTGKGWSMSKTASSAKRYKNKVDKLPRIIDRFRYVQVEHNTWERILEIYDGPETFFYLDPPYIHATRKGGSYRNEMTDDDHQRLLDKIQTLEGKVMLSGYPNDLYKQLPWKPLEIKIRATSMPSEHWDGEQNMRTESVWMNYDPLFITGWNTKK